MGKSGSFISSRRVRDETKLLVMHVAGGARFGQQSTIEGGKQRAQSSPVQSRTDCERFQCSGKSSVGNTLTH